jgi:hypothetical protein
MYSQKAKLNRNILRHAEDSLDARLRRIRENKTTEPDIAYSENNQEVEEGNFRSQ